MAERSFRDRRDAGRALAGLLEHYRGRDDVVVLALPRGGVPVGYEVATELGVPLDVFVVRKLGVPGREEFAMGAIASGDVVVVNDDVVRGLGIGLIPAATRVGQRNLFTVGGAPDVPPAWSTYAPTTVKLPDGSVKLSTKFTRLTGRSPILLAGMTPTTVTATPSSVTARPTISGSNNGRDRASFFGISEAGSFCGTFPTDFGSVVTVDIIKACKKLTAPFRRGARTRAFRVETFLDA